MSLYIGLMSGTSMDGIDAALINADTHELIHGLTKPYTPDLRQTLLGFDPQQKTTATSLLELNVKLGKAFADAAQDLIQDAGYDANAIIAVGSHGQTLLHRPMGEIPLTLQLACPHTISTQTQMTVVADFRTRDIALGGQGAPFAPLYHHELFKAQSKPLAIVNIGGIANVTLLNEGKPTKGYDTGPGNVLLDFWVQKYLGQSYDKSGTWASQGQCIPSLLQAMLEDDFFTKQAPKSIDKAYFNATWLHDYLTEAYNPEDIQTTLTHLTAKSIVDAIHKECIRPKLLLISGGGAQNAFLLTVLQDYLPDVRVESTAAFQVDPNYLEAMMFAWLAHQTIQRKPVDLSAITGAKAPSILGAIYPCAA